MTHVVDTSVVLAHFFREPGGEVLLTPDRCNHLSIINLSEIYTKIVELGATLTDVKAVIAARAIRIRAFREVDAEQAALLRVATKHRGLSFGDRACLALAKTLSLPVLTADKQWADLDIGIDVRLIR